MLPKETPVLEKVVAGVVGGVVTSYYLNVKCKLYEQWNKIFLYSHTFNYESFNISAIMAELQTTLEKVELLLLYRVSVKHYINA